MFVRTLVVGAALIGGGMVPLAGAASAQTADAQGRNGQQIMVSTHFSDAVEICGDNQNGKWVCSPVFRTPGNGYTKLRGWWWKGTVAISGYNDNSSKVRHMNCEVHEEEYSDWTQCNGQKRKRL